VLLDSTDIILEHGEVGVNRVVVARTRAGCRLSAAGLTGMAATGPRREAQAVSNEKPQLATERHRLAKIGDERAG